MTGRRLTLVVVLVAAAAGLSMLASPASAHCPEDGGDEFQGTGQSTCPANEPLEQAIDRANAASGDDRAFVLVKDRSFHPPVVNVADGGTVTFVWADPDQNEQHLPISSGVGDEDCNEAWMKPVECTPKRSGTCFGANGFMSDYGDRYTLTFRSTDAGGVEVSEGPISGTPVPFAPPFYECAENSYVEGPNAEFGLVEESDSLVIPYHCQNHGTSETPYKKMRGAIVLEK